MVKLLKGPWVFLIALVFIPYECLSLPIVIGLDGGATLSFADAALYETAESTLLSSGSATPLSVPGYGWKAGLYGEVVVIESFSIGQDFNFVVWSANSSSGSMKVTLESWGLGSSTYARYSLPPSDIGRLSFALGLTACILPSGLDDSFQSGGVSATVTDSASATITDWTMSLGLRTEIGWASPALAADSMGGIGFRCSLGAQYDYGQFGFTDVSPAFFPLVISAKAGLEYRYEPNGRIEGSAVAEGPAVAGIPKTISAGEK